MNPKVLRLLMTLAGCAAIAAAPGPAVSTPIYSPSTTMRDGRKDFDFFVGTWSTHSRRLKVRLAGSHTWEEFDGTIRNFALMDGQANVDDAEFKTPEGVYRGVATRAYDPRTGLWSIWWIDGRNPHAPLDPPMDGRFVHGVGTFYGADTLRGKRIKARFVWSHITATTARWEQAYSGDGGKTWEVNWIQEVHRIK